MTLSSSVGDGGGVSIKVGIVISTVISAVVVVGVGVVRFGGTTLLLVVFVFSVPGSFGPSAFLSRLLGLSGVMGLLLLSWSHIVSIGDAVVNGDRGFRS